MTDDPDIRDDELDRETAEGFDETEEHEEEEFGELLIFTGTGFVGGFLLGAALDWFGLQRSPIGQWIVRTISGEGESILEGIYAMRQRLRGAHGSMAEAYGWGKFIGITIPWFIDWGSRAAGVDVDGVAGFYIPFFYAMSDQVGGSTSGFLYLKRKRGSWGAAAKAYLSHPVMLASASVILIVPVGLLTARILGFSPTTQTYTALETIAANLCWIPPLIGWLLERRRK